MRDYVHLSEKERVGICIDETESIDPLKGSQFTLAARVVTHKVVSRESFMGVFACLWRGMDGVSIKEIGDDRFLIQFENLKDKLRVVEMEPWTFRHCLVVVVEGSTWNGCSQC